MNTYNKTFNDKWDYLKELHPSFAPGTIFGESLDLSIKPKIKQAQYCLYMGAIYQVIAIGLRENFITAHQDRHGCPVYIKFIGKSN